MPGTRGYNISDILDLNDPKGGQTTISTSDNNNSTDHHNSNHHSTSANSHHHHHHQQHQQSSSGRVGSESSTGGISGCGTSEHSQSILSVGSIGSSHASHGGSGLLGTPLTSSSTTTYLTPSNISNHLIHNSNEPVVVGPTTIGGGHYHHLFPAATRSWSHESNEYYGRFVCVPTCVSFCPSKNLSFCCVNCLFFVFFVMSFDIMVF